MNRFKLTLRLGNDAMQTPEDVAEALRRAADYIEEYAGSDWEMLDGASILDQNGNNVGSWGVEL